MGYGQNTYGGGGYGGGNRGGSGRGGYGGNRGGGAGRGGNGGGRRNPNGPCTENQSNFLANHGRNPNCTFAEASKQIDEINRNTPCSEGQAAVLANHGYNGANFSKATANDKIEQIKANGWERPNEDGPSGDGRPAPSRYAQPASQPQYAPQAAPQNGYVPPQYGQQTQAYQNPVQQPGQMTMQYAPPQTGYLPTPAAPFPPQGYPQPAYQQPQYAPAPQAQYTGPVQNGYQQPVAATQGHDDIPF